MSIWSAKRRITYLVGAGLFIIIFIILPVIFLSRDTPTCFDQKQNGDEKGIDCGGTCELLCGFEATKPNVLWNRAFKVSKNIYSATAYVENTNVSSEAENAAYTFTFYNSANQVIGSRSGTTYIPKNKIFAVFEPTISLEEAPARTTFAFNGEIRFVKSLTTVPDLTVRNKRLVRESSTPRVEATLKNDSVENLRNIEVTALVYDGKDNVIGSSRTYVDQILAGATSDVVFTWPEAFQTQETICKVAADVMLVIDRSGSMASDGNNPPEPLTSVKEAATLFINQLESDDRAGVISYATDASKPADAGLTNDFEKVLGAIANIKIQTGSLQQTNISAGIEAAGKEFDLAAVNTLAKKIIILLTDGEPTRPLSPSDKDYPKNTALALAQNAKNADATIYTVGLGKSVNSDFLSALATSPAHYFAAIDKDNLGKVYTDIASSICKDSPTTIEIISTVLP
jgi:Mg-chelatase subunit ChlD